MAHSETQHADADPVLGSLAEMYPLAFALTSASSFRTGLVLLRQESVRLRCLADPPSLQNPLPESASNNP